MALKPYNYLTCRKCKHPRIDHVNVGKFGKKKNCLLCDCPSVKNDLFYHLDLFNMMFFGINGLGLFSLIVFSVFQNNFVKGIEMYLFCLFMSFVYSILHIKSRIKQDLKQRGNT